jgi:hypothetical protein
MPMFPSMPIDQRALQTMWVLILLFFALFIYWAFLLMSSFLIDFDEEIHLFGHWMCLIFEDYSSFSG